MYCIFGCVCMLTHFGLSDIYVFRERLLQQRFDEYDRYAASTLHTIRDSLHTDGEQQQ